MTTAGTAGVQMRASNSIGYFLPANLGGFYGQGMVYLGENSQDGSATEHDGRGLGLRMGYKSGALVPMGAGEWRASYSSYRLDEDNGTADPRAQKLALGYVHNLSKRTAVYATVARVTNRNGSAISLGGSTYGTGVANGSSTGYDIGIRHSF